MWRKFLSGFGVLALLGSVLAVSQPASAQQAGDIVPGSYIVTFDSDTVPGATAAEMGKAHGFQVRHVYSQALNGMAIQIPTGAAEAGILTALRSDPRVLSIGADLYISAVDIVTDGLNRIHGGAYNVGVPSSGAGVTVAVFDTGLDFNHTDLKDNINTSLSVDCMGIGCVPGGQDDHWHGTFVGGIIAAADNGQDIIGVAPNATLIAVKVLDSTGFGTFAGVTAGVDYITGLGSGVVQVGNMSLGAYCNVCTDDSTNSTVIAFHTAIDNMVAAGITLVVAAGNDNADAANDIPAAFDSVITASAIYDRDGQPGGLGGSGDDTRASFSNFGADIDITAPGVSVTSLYLGGGLASSSGTSFSSPYTAGVVAAYIGAGGSSDPAVVRSTLIQSGECHENAGDTLFRDQGSCAEVWPGDPDGIAEPMVRADTLIEAPPPPPVFDVAITAVAVDTTPMVVGVLNSVSVIVANIGDFDASNFSVSLTDDGNLVETQSGVSIAAGSSKTLVLNWTPSSTGPHDLTASHNIEDEVPTNDSTTTNVIVPTSSTDIAVDLVTVERTVNKGDIVDVMVDVSNNGTTEETVTVTLADFADGSIGEVSGPQTFTILAQAQVTLTFTWDTTNASEETHILQASHNLKDDNNTNNSAVTVSHVVVPPPPDIHDVAAISIAAPGSLESGAKTVINVLVTNLSSVSEQFLLVLSTTGGTLTNTDGSTPGGTRTIGPLTKDGGSTSMNYLWDTTGAAEGTVTLTATVTHNDSDGSVDEDLANNTVTTTVSIQVPSTTDVAVTSVSAPATVTQGGTVDVFVDVSNNGNTGETVTVTLADTGGAAAGGVSGSQTFTINAGAQVTRTFTWNTTGASADAHTLTASHGLADDDATNDSASTSSTVSVPDTHDVAVLSVSAPAEVTQGGTVDVFVDVSNTGTTNETVTVTLADTGGAAAGGVSGSQTFTINAGAQVTRTFTWNTTGASADAHTLTASHGLADDDATNNSASTSSTVSVPDTDTHDVAVTGASAPGKVKPGKTANVSVTLENLGTVDETVRVTLSTTGGTVSSPQMVTVSVGGSTQVTFSWDTTGATEGTHTLTATVTPDDNTSNDTGSTTSFVGNGKGGSGGGGGGGGGSKPCNPNKKNC